MFPIEEDTSNIINRLAFGDVTKVLVDRFNKVVNNVEDVFITEESKYARKCSSLSTALMKAVCYSRGWIEEVTTKKGEQFSARVLIIKSSMEDPTQHTPIVNAIFAC